MHAIEETHKVGEERRVAYRVELEHLVVDVRQVVVAQVEELGALQRRVRGYVARIPVDAVGKAAYPVVAQVQIGQVLEEQEPKVELIDHVVAQYERVQVGQLAEEEHVGYGGQLIVAQIEVLEVDEVVEGGLAYALQRVVLEREELQLGETIEGARADRLTDQIAAQIDDGEAGRQRAQIGRRHAQVRVLDDERERLLQYRILRHVGQIEEVVELRPGARDGQHVVEVGARAICRTVGDDCLSQAGVAHSHQQPHGGQQWPHSVQEPHCRKFQNASLASAVRAFFFC